MSERAKYDGAKVIAGNMTVSRAGAVIKVQRLELTRLGAELITSKVAKGIESTFSNTSASQGKKREVTS